LENTPLTLFVHLVAVYGSAILAMAAMKSYLKGAEAYELSRLDELWQIKYWGEDEEAKERSDAIRSEVIALCQLLES
jgi:chaperone required for assembly of F1-ATPase